MHIGNRPPALSRLRTRRLRFRNSQARSRVFGIVGSLTVALVGLAMPGRANSITGTFSGTATLTPSGSPGVFVQNFTGNGDDTTFGLFTASSTSTVDFSAPPSIVISSGTLSEIFAGGTLMGTSSGDGTASGLGTATFTIDLVITGGTGAFAGDTGDVNLTGTITQTSPTTESISGSYTGSIAAVPEPSTLVLLAAGFAGLRLRLRKRVVKPPVPVVQFFKIYQPWSSGKRW